MVVVLLIKVEALTAAYARNEGCKLVKVESVYEYTHCDQVCAYTSGRCHIGGHCTRIVTAEILPGGQRSWGERKKSISLRGRDEPRSAKAYDLENWLAVFQSFFSQSTRPIACKTHGSLPLDVFSGAAAAVHSKRRTWMPCARARARLIANRGRRTRNRRAELPVTTGNALPARFFAAWMTRGKKESDKMNRVSELRTFCRTSSNGVKLRKNRVRQPDVEIWAARCNRR